MDGEEATGSTLAQGSVEVALQHPDVFFMNLDAGNAHVSRFGVLGLFGDVTGVFEAFNDLAMPFGKMPDHGVGIGVFGDLLHAGEFGEVAESARCQGTEGANPLGDFIDGGEHLVVLCLERLVQREESFAADVPMTEMGLSEECVCIRHDLLIGISFFIPLASLTPKARGRWGFAPTILVKNLILVLRSPHEAFARRDLILGCSET